MASDGGRIILMVMLDFGNLLMGFVELHVCGTFLCSSIRSAADICPFGARVVCALETCRVRGLTSAGCGCARHKHAEKGPPDWCWLAIPEA